MLLDLMSFTSISWVGRTIVCLTDLKYCILTNRHTCMYYHILDLMVTVSPPLSLFVPLI